MRHNYDNNWADALKLITNAVNHSSNRGIDGLIPAEVNTPEFDPIVREARQLVASRRKRKYPQKEIYRVGQFVYVDFDQVCFLPLQKNFKLIFHAHIL